MYTVFHKKGLDSRFFLICFIFTITIPDRAQIRMNFMDVDNTDSMYKLQISFLNHGKYLINSFESELKSAKHFKKP